MTHPAPVPATPPHRPLIDDGAPPRAFVKRLGSLARIFGVRNLPNRTAILYDYGECDDPTCRGLNKDGTCPNGYGATCLGYRDRLAGPHV